ncbi:hypothetical protein WJ63_35140 [Burkholderia pyrrocinia]|nr:hypothetical protein WJ63_35140 [Burkholderia pyrrocinia]
MAELQKINLGTPPLGRDGDPNRTAHQKMNDNADVLAAQVALTSAPMITTPQTLTSKHVGKRVNISLAKAGAVNLPAASECDADSVILLRNVGMTVVATGSATGSGDTVALSQLNPGESALMDTDGVHAWTPLMRGRTTSDNEAINGNLSVGGSVSVTGTITASDGVVLPDKTRLSTFIPEPVAQCYLTTSGSSLMLTRKNGCYLTIQGVARMIPAAGVTLAGSGATAQTRYFVYAYMAGNTMALEASTTGYVSDAATGLPVKSGDASRTLVGMIFCLQAGTWLQGADRIDCLSYFNRVPRLASGINNGGQAQADTVWVAMPVMNWSGETIEASVVGFGNTPGPGNTSSVYIAFDGKGVGVVQRFSNINANFAFPVGFAVCATLDEGRYMWQLRGMNDGQLLSMSAAFYVRTRG